MKKINDMFFTGPEAGLTVAVLGLIMSFVCLFGGSYVKHNVALAAWLVMPFGVSLFLVGILSLCALLLGMIFFLFER